jgi:hypothetical protein
MATKTKSQYTRKANAARCIEGNCFQLAAKSFLGLTDNNWPNLLEALPSEFKPTKVQLVHGFPFQRIPGGVRMAHAWIECRIMNHPLVIDLGGGRKVNPTIHDLSSYYRLGQMKPEECHRYSAPKTVCRHLAGNGTWGPWQSIPADVDMPGYRGPRH